MAAEGFPDPQPFRAGVAVSGARGSATKYPVCPRMVVLPDVAIGGPAVITPLVDLHVTVHVHVSVAFVSLSARFRNPAARPGTCVFELPMNSKATVTAVDVLLDDGKAFASCVIDGTEAAGAKSDPALEGAMEAYFSSVAGTYRAGSYDPRAFRVPVTDVPAASIVTVKAQYFQQMVFSAGSYTLSVPTTVPDGVLEEGAPLAERLTIHCEMNTGTLDSRWQAATHAMDVADQSPGRVVLDSSRVPGRSPNADFSIGYQAWSPRILTNLQVQPDRDGKGGNFALFVSPPQEDAVAALSDGASAEFGRRVVFMIDNSGSMTGRPMDNAKSALVLGLRQLRPGDSFAICVFNHEQEWWVPSSGAGEAIAGATAPGAYGASSGAGGYSAAGAARDPYGDIGVRAALVRPEGLRLQPATAANLADAESYAKSIHTTGMTNILAPVQQSMELLAESLAFDDPQATRSLPLLFMLTDGAVPNERDVCIYVRDQVKELPVRVFTFGIGMYCNHYFLKMMAQLGRGYSDINLTGAGLEGDIVALMSKASLPVLLDVALVMDVTGAELYPFPIPDLFVGAPLVIAGRYTGTFPATIKVHGRMASRRLGRLLVGDGGGTVASDSSGLHYFTQTVTTTQAMHVPVGTVFVKQRLDLLIANDWLLEGKDPGLKATVINASIEASMPCPYTTMVLYPTTAKAIEGGESKEDDGGAAAPKKRSVAPAVLAAGAGVVVLGAAVVAAAAFGDVAASAGSGLVDSMGGFSGVDFTGGVDLPGCGCLQDLPCCGACAGGEGMLDGCFGNCGDCCGECGGAFSSCFGEISGGFTSCCTACGEGAPCQALGNCGGGLATGVCGGIGSCCQTAGDCMSGAMGSCSEFCQNIDCTAACAGACACFGTCFNSASDCLGGCMGGMGDCMGSAAGCAGDLCGDIGDVLSDLLGNLPC